MVTMKKIDDTNRHETAIVSSIYYKMFYLRLMGCTYGEIAEKTDYSIDRVRHIFAKGGVLYELWEGWRETAKDEAIEEALTIMHGNLPDIVRNLVVLARSPIPASIIAARVIFAYTLGNPNTKEFHGVSDSTPKTFTDWIRQETLREKEMLKEEKESSQSI